MSRVRVGELDIAYRVTGAGPALLLVAGTGYNGGTWWPGMVNDLAREYTVITYDHRGTGRTRGPSGPFSTRTLARDALGLLAALGVSGAHVLGHSMGGRVAQWMALEGGARVGGLVLAASGPGPLPGHEDRHTPGIPVATAAGMVELGYDGYVRRLQRDTFFTESYALAHPEPVDWLFDAFWAGRPTVTDYFRHVMARQQHDTVELLRLIAHPTLVLVGDEDAHAGGTGSHLEQSLYLARALPSATLSVIPGVKHGYFWEAPVESVGRVKRWLAGVDTVVTS
ncbi:alpha/beta fold hydrolase [Jiangella rhizosphaerae]|uniref:Alpha/beta hydrolase n=1 Tax=Jiangella rhizosphaerae TaxID=2293569 RepID=A0A418KWF6_9ACTN|nr:alpha/beta hydrolase [Jiangella rhizosphaerae]RIQ35887.1 alpha/beta hydrolase [Jiangella rhizosphaerae]